MERRWRVLGAFAITLLVGWAAYTWLQSAQLLTRLYNPFPTWDYWRVVAFLDRYQAFDLRVLWQQHNEHRIIFPELFFAADMLLFRGRLLLPIALSVCCYLAAWALLCYTLFTDKAVRFEIKLAATFLTALVVGWKGIAVALAAPFLLQWTLLEICVVGALLGLCGLNVGFSSCIAFGLVATYTSGNGMLLWPVLIGFAVVLGLPPRNVLILAAAGAVSVALYFAGYKPLHKLDLSNFWLHPLYSLEFIGAYLGMPLGGIKGPLFGPVVGLANLTATIALAITAAKRRLLQSRPAIVFFGFYAFVLLSALMIAAGRINPAEARFSSAEASRYLAIPLLNWAVVILVLLWISARLRWRIVSPVVCCAVLAVLIGLGFPKLRWWLKYQQMGYADEQLASLAVADGITNPHIVRHVFPDPGFVAAYLPRLRQQHLSIFANGRFDMIGKPLAGRILSQAGGAITYAGSVHDGIEFAGWSAQSDWIVLVDASNRVVGLGEHLRAGLPNNVPPQLSRQAEIWFGFAKTNADPASISAYAMTQDGLRRLDGHIER